MTHAHQDAAEDHQRRRGETELLGAEERGDHDVTTGAQATVALDGDAVTKTPEHQGLLGFGEPDLPRQSGMVQRGEQRRAGAPVVTGDQDHVGVRFDDARRDRTDPETADQFDVNTCGGVGAAQVVDQLGEVLDRIDVVVRGR